MSDQQGDVRSARLVLRDKIREVRARYDRADRGMRAALRRCRSADELALESAYWKLGGQLAHDDRLAQVVLLFPTASQASTDNFSFGRFLRKQIGKSDSAPLRLRRVLDSRDRDELAHRLRGLLKLAAGTNGAIDWGAFGVDLFWFFNEGDFVRRRWAQDFFAPAQTQVPEAEASAATSLLP